MKSKTQNKQEHRARRQKRIRSKIFGTESRPRLSVFKSNQYLTAQLIDDNKGVTLAAASSKELKTKKESAKVIGKLIAERAIAKKIGEAVFDRGGYSYRGNVKALAEAAREGGLKF